jgi:hypothetical protein
MSTITPSKVKGRTSEQSMSAIVICPRAWSSLENRCRVLLVVYMIKCEI